MAAVLPTKGNLMATKRSRSLARTGYELMDRKRNILIREMMSLMDTAKSVQDQIDTVFTEAYASLQVANIKLGLVDRISRRWSWMTRWSCSTAPSWAWSCPISQIAPAT